MLWGKSFAYLGLISPSVNGTAWTRMMSQGPDSTEELRFQMRVYQLWPAGRGNLANHAYHWPDVLLHPQLHSRWNGQKEKLTQYFLSLFCLPIQPCTCPFQAGNLLDNIITGTPRTATICHLPEYFGSFFLRLEYYKDSSIKLLNKVGPENNLVILFPSQKQCL